MLIRLWRNYWAGTWLMLAGLAAVPLCWLAGTIIFRFHVADGVVVWWSTVAASALACAVALAGFAVWAYRFHTEPHQGGNNGRATRP